MSLTAEELMAGREITYDIDVPRALFEPNPDGPGPTEPSGRSVRIRPLTVKDIQLIARAARDDEVLTSVLMIQRSVVEPALTQADINQFSSGLVRFLVERINRISGLSATDDELRELAASPIVQAFVVLAREFHWTPEEVRGLTVGQILGYLELVGRTRGGAA